MSQTGSISVRCVGWTGISPPLVKVFIDDQEVGTLQNKHAHVFPASAGLHLVVVRRDFWRSLPLDVEVPPGGRAALECGFRIWGSSLRLEAIKLAFLAIMGLVLALVVAGGLPLWSVWVAFGAEVVAFGIVWWRLFTPPGAYLFLHPVPAAEP